MSSKQLRLMVSRFFRYKKDADKHAAWLRRNGATKIRIWGKRGCGAWRVRSSVPVELAMKIATYRKSNKIKCIKHPESNYQ